MTFRILSADDEADCAEWWRLLSLLPSSHRDLHFEPGYVRAYARSKFGQGLCAVYNWGSTLIVHPFVRRGDEIGIAYGYGGPVASPYARDYADHIEHLDQWMRRQGIRRETFRLWPFFEQMPHEHEVKNIKQQKLIVFLDLALPPEEELTKGHKAAVTAAAKAGVRVIEWDNLDVFMDLYYGMLNRHQAADKWRFRKSLLEELCGAYPVAGFIVIAALVKGEPEVACVLLGAHDTCYYHYAASKYLPRAGAGHLLVVEAARWARERGYKRLHLGGGLTDDPQDGLLRFKSGFSKRRAWVYTCNREVAP